MLPFSGSFRALSSYFNSSILISAPDASTTAAPSASAQSIAEDIRSVTNQIQDLLNQIEAGSLDPSEIEARVTDLHQDHTDLLALIEEEELGASDILSAGIIPALAETGNNLNELAELLEGEDVDLGSLTALVEGAYSANVAMEDDLHCEYD